MSNIRKIIFDSQSFPFTPYTRHVTEINDGLRMIFIDHSAEPQKKKFVVDLEDLFENPAQKRALGKKTLFISMSGKPHDPMIDFRVGQKTVQVRAYDYIKGYQIELLIRPDLFQKTMSDPHIAAELEKQWSINFFKEELREILDEHDAVYGTIFNGIDNAMGDVWRVEIIMKNDKTGQSGSAKPAPPDEPT